MSFSRILIIASAAATLVSCEMTSGRVDASYPTASEMDRLDTQWGLPPRKSRGAPKRTYQYSAPTASYGSPAAVESSAPAVAPRETINSAPPTASPSVDPATLNSLR